MLKWLVNTVYRKEKGFTLIEIAIVVTVIGILAGVILPRALHVKDDAVAKVKAVNIKNVQTAVDLYYLEKGSYPVSSGNVDFTLLVPDYINEKPEGTYTIDNGVVK